MIVVSRGAQEMILKLLVNLAQPENLTLRLFCNDIEPDLGCPLSDFTEVSRAEDYEPISLIPSGWTIPPTGGPRAVYPEQKWTFSGHVGLVYGWYMTQTKSGQLVMAERFTGPDAPFLIAYKGDSIRLIPSISFLSGAK